MDDHMSNNQTLNQILDEAGKLDTVDATRLIGQILESLQELHRSNKIHRNLCTEEILIDSDGNASLSDPLSTDVECSVDLPEFESLDKLSLPPAIDLAQQRIAQAGVDCDPRRVDLFNVGRVALEMISTASVDDYLNNPTVKNEIDANLQDFIDSALGFHTSQPAGSADDLSERLTGGRHNEVTIAPSTITSDNQTIAPTISPTTNIENDADSDYFQLSPTTLQNQSGELDQTSGFKESNTSAASRMPFKKLGQFELIRRLGQGGMGAVFLASDVRLERLVALKVLTPNLASNPDFVRRFQNEARSAAKLEHQHIVPIYNIDQDQGYHFFVMQYVEGESLAEILRKEHKLDEATALRIIEQIASGLVEAHSLGLIHRDIKPANIMVQAKDNKAMLADFGLVKSDHTVLGTTATGVIMGTVNYISPEQGRGQKVDARSDLYSIGVTLYQILAGQMPFRAENATAMIFQHVYEPPNPIRDIAPELTNETVKIIERLLQKEPDQRYQNAQDLVNDVQAIRNGQTLSSRSPLRSDAVVKSAFDIEQLDDWMKDWDDSGADLASGEINENEEARLLALIDDHAPEPIKRLKNAYQQVKGGLAVYNTRHKELVETIVEAEKAEQEIATKISNVEQQITHAEQTLADLPDGADDSAQQSANDHLASLEELTEVMAKQKSDTSNVRKKLDHVDKTIDDLQQQQRMLIARLKKAEAEISATRRSPKTNSSRFSLVAGLTAVCLALVTGAIFLWPRIFPAAEATNVANSDNVATSASNFVAAKPEFSAADRFETAGSEKRGSKVYAYDGQIDYRHLISIPDDTEGENWQRDELDIRLTQPSTGHRLAIPLTTKDTYDFNIEYTTDDGAFDVAIPVGTEGLALLRLGYNKGNGIQLLGVTGTKSSNDHTFVNCPIFKFNRQAKNQVLIWVKFTNEGLATLTVTVNDTEVFHRERAEQQFQFTESFAQHTRGAVPMIIGNTGGEICFKKLAVRLKGSASYIIRRRQPPLRIENTAPVHGLKFTGSTEEIVGAHNFNYSGKHPITVETWVIPEEKTNAHIVNMCNNKRVGMITLKIGNQGHWEFLLRGRTLVSVVSNEPVEWNQRAHVAGIFENGRIELFVNGVKQSQRRTVSNIKPQGKEIRIGSNFWTGGRNHFYKGTVDQVRVSKVRVYESNFTPADKLSADKNSMAMYDLDEKFGRLIIDQSGREFARLKVDMKTVRESEELTATPKPAE